MHDYTKNVNILILQTLEFSFYFFSWNVLVVMTQISQKSYSYKSLLDIFCLYLTGSTEQPKKIYVLKK